MFLVLRASFMFFNGKSFLFLHCHLKKGDSILGTVSRVMVGPSEILWGYGYKRMIHYLDQCYHPILSHDDLERLFAQFPMFAEKNQETLEKHQRRT